LTKIIPLISDFLETKLKLSLHSDKIFIKTLASGIDFLGWINFPYYRILRTTAKKTDDKTTFGETKRTIHSILSGNVKTRKYLQIAKENRKY